MIILNMQTFNSTTLFKIKNIFQPFIINLYIAYNCYRLLWCFLTGKIIKERFVDLPKQQVSFGWTELGGDVFIPDRMYYPLLIDW